MTTINDLISRNKHRIARRLYIKRRDLTETYEASWVRIDNWKNKARVKSDGWGESFTATDNDSQIIGTFEVSGISFTVDNSQGHFNSEFDPNSIWYSNRDYLNRRYTKIELETGYIDDDGSEVGTATDFEGYIDRIETTSDETATINCLSYQSIFQRYSISDLSLTDEMTVEAVVTAITNQSKITTYMPYVAPDADFNYTITEAENLSGTYWDVLTELAFKSNSVLYLVGSTFKFQKRTAGSSVWDFNGRNSKRGPTDIYNINYYDDEGADRVRLRFESSDGEYSIESGNASLKAKYKPDPEVVDLSYIKESSRLFVLSNLLGENEYPRKRISFNCKFLLNIVKPLDKITINIRGVNTTDNSGIYDISTYGNAVYANEIGGLIVKGTWKILSVHKNYSDYFMTIEAERIS